MFIVDDLIGDAVGDIFYLYKKRSHKLKRFLAKSDNEGFWDYFVVVLDKDSLRKTL